MMVELFGEGKPAAVDYDDQYGDLADEVLDFDQFDSLNTPSDDAPDWARSVRRGTPATAGGRKAIKIGKRLAVLEVTIFSENDHEPVAHATGTYSIPP